MLTSQFFSFRLSIVLAVASTMILGVGLAACDSGGSNGDPPPKVARTFTVTVVSFENNYQYSDQNNVGVAYAIDGQVGQTITLERGQTYEFELEESVSSGPEGFPHPFYIGSTAEGQGNDAYSNGVENAKETSGTVTFSVPADAPNDLYYVCGNHAYMGGDMNITGSSDGSDDGSDDNY